MPVEDRPKPPVISQARSPETPRSGISLSMAFSVALGVPLILQAAFLFYSDDLGEFLKRGSETFVAMYILLCPITVPLTIWLILASKKFDRHGRPADLRFLWLAPGAGPY